LLKVCQLLRVLRSDKRVKGCEGIKSWPSMPIGSQSLSGSAITAVFAGLDKTGVALGADDV